MRPYHAHGLVHVTVGEDDERGLPSELQGDLLHVAHRAALADTDTADDARFGSRAAAAAAFSALSPFHDVLSDLRGAREAQLPYVRVVGQALTHQSA